MVSSEKKVLMVIAPIDFRDEEFLKPKDVFEKSGFEVMVASKGVKEAKGVLGAKVEVEIDLSQVDIAQFEALVFVGGPGSSVYFNDQTALALAQAAVEQGKVVGAICIAPSILANAGVLKDRKATAWASEQGNLESQGAVYTGAKVEIDGRIVTAKGPEAAVEFGEKIVELLEEGR